MLKYGVLSILRTPVKTVTFFLLIAVVTAALSLGLGMWQSAGTLLEEADAAFITAGQFTYDGAGGAVRYDERLSAVSGMFDLAAVTTGDVLFAEGNVTQRAYVEGYTPSVYGISPMEYAVLTVSVLQYNEAVGAYGAYVSDDIYSIHGLENAYVYLLCGRDDARFTEGRRYALVGYVRDLLVTPVKSIEPMPEEGLVSGDYAYTVPPLTDITDYASTRDFVESAACAAFKEAGEVFRILSESVNVTATGDIRIVEGFHSGRYTLTAGGLFDGADAYECVVPQRVAAQMKLSVGDSIRVRFHQPTGQTAAYYSYHPQAGFAAEEVAYTVAGIYQSDEIDLPIFVPHTGQAFFAHSGNDPVLARVSVDKRRAEEYRAAVAALGMENVRFTMDDQGYKAMAITISAMRETSAVVTLLCLFLCAAALWLFGLLFVGRSERSARALLLLGAGKKRVLLYFLSFGGLIAASASVLGAGVGFAVSKLALMRVYEAAAANSAYDFRFSVIGYGARNAHVAEGLAASPWVYVLLAPAVTLAALLFCMYFALVVVRKMNPRRGLSKQKRAKNKPVRVMRAIGAGLRLPSAAWRYGVRSALRGGMRSLAAPVLFAVMVFFICVFQGVNEGFRTEMDAVYDNVPVTMRFSDISGKRLDNLLISSRQTDAVLATGFPEAVWASANIRFMVLGVTGNADGTSPASLPEPFSVPETLSERIAFLDHWTELSDENTLLRTDGGAEAFAQAPEFAYAPAPEIAWADGYDAERFFTMRDGYDDFTHTIVSDAFLRRHDLSAGDKIAVVYLASGEAFMGGGGYYETELTIAGSFPSGTNRAKAYTYCDESLWIDEYEWISRTERTLVNTRFHAAGFRIGDTKRLSEFKDMLEEIADPLGVGGKNRVWAVIADEALYSAADSLSRYTGYIKLLFPILLAVAAGIGFIVSHLLLKGRAGEIACLRGIGMPERSVFAAFFSEQLLLSFCGAAIGALAAFAYGGAGMVYAGSILLLAVCYYAGLSLAIRRTYRMAALEAITATEE